ncbi:glycosyltransferase family 4 protein [Bremerella alba]|uniref:D-inositol-3-phosphate glycosyltransferase n=1 Tax=Bremerella alba TaxID=980252 RepID=A0A7V9A6R8_9BACT|nr:glycosyltransferase family 4 protein [Bremerella alba]MBA2114246.1 D-inositol-3-phosphate glycosyltransferase [Bremerella alba]
MQQADQSTSDPLTIAYLTAGGAGMFCGSCMRDNTVARAMHHLGHDVHLLPMYTPIRVDEEDVSEKTLFYGGINVYMEQNVPGYRFLPDMVTRWLDQEWIIRWATSRGIETSAKQLGGLTLSVLKGKDGNQRKEAQRLAKWVAEELRPQVVNFSNMMIAGTAPLLKEKIDCPILVTLQGDDIFMDDLPEPYRSKCFAQIRELATHVDGFIVFSNYYADYMAEYFGVPRAKFHLVPLGIDLSDFPEKLDRQTDVERPPTIGYLARMAPEKGLHVLVDAFMHLRAIPGMEDARLKIAGWAGKQQQPYLDQQFAKLRSAGHFDGCEYLGTVDRAGKLAFLHSIDVLSVPTVYREPKGLFVLEAWSAGVPVVQPEHGAFPELIAATGGGHLVPPEDPIALAEKLAEVLVSRESSRALGKAASEMVRTKFAAHVAASETVEVYRSMLARKSR